MHTRKRVDRPTDRTSFGPTQGDQSVPLSAGRLELQVSVKRLVDGGGALCALECAFQDSFGFGPVQPRPTAQMRRYASSPRARFTYRYGSSFSASEWTGEETGAAADAGAAAEAGDAGCLTSFGSHSLDGAFANLRVATDRE